MPYRYNAITGELDLVMDVGSSGGITQIDMDTGTVTPIAGVVNLNGENGISTSGSSNNGTISSTGFITPYVVSQDSDTDYSTIQDALDAANAAGGGIIWVRSGTYTEDLTLYDNTQIKGAVGEADSGDVIITGSHTPPLTGTFSFTDVQLQHSSAIISSLSAGSATISLNRCVFVVTNGYVIDADNWTGQFRFDDCGNESVNDGVINNSVGAATVFTNNSLLGAGTGQTCNLSGSVRLDLTQIASPMTITGSSLNEFNIVFLTGATSLGGSATYVMFGSEVLATMTTSGSCNTIITTTNFITQANAAISHGSSGILSIASSIITSSNNPAIDGAGTGTTTLTNISFTDNAVISGSLNLGNSTPFPTRMGNGQLLIGEAGQPPRVANLSSTGGTVSITNGSGSINLEAGATTPTQFDTDSGSATPAANILNVLGGTLLGSTGAGNMVTINADDNVVGSVASDSGTATPTSNSFTIAGSGGITTSGSSATITVDGSAFQQFAWTEITVTGPTSTAEDNGYIANNASTVGFTLPSTAAVGSIIRITGKGTGGWSLGQNAGQTIYFGASATTTGAGGSLASTADRDTIALVCVTEDTDFNVLSSIGNITVV